MAPTARSSIGSELVTHEVLARIPKTRDLETHLIQVSLGTLGEQLELRDYCPSTGNYGRTFWLASDQEFLDALREALATAGRRA